MAIFLGVHKFPEGLGEAEVTQGWESYKQAATGMGLKPLEVVVSSKKGFAYCQTEADSEDQVRKAHQKVNIPLEDVLEVNKLA